MISLNAIYILSTCHLIVMAYGVESRNKATHAAEPAHITQPNTAGTRVMEHLITGTTINNGFVGNATNTRASGGKLNKKSIRNKIARKKQTRMLDVPGSTCLSWSPNLNATTDSKLRSILVDYCQSQDIPVPTTYTCLKTTNVTLCLILEKPQCKHSFESLTSGNFTVYIKPLCERCFNMRVHRKPCPTAIFTRSVILEELINGQEASKSGQSDSNDFIIILVSCSAVLAIGLLLVGAFLKRYYAVRPSTASVDTSSNQASFLQLQHMPADQTAAEQSSSQSSPNSGQEKDASFTHSAAQTDNQALLANLQTHERKTVEQEQQLSYLEYQSYPPSHGNITQSELFPLAADVENNFTSDSTGTSLLLYHNTADAGSPANLCAAKNREEVSIRKIQMPPGSRTMFDIPYHLILNDN